MPIHRQPKTEKFAMILNAVFEDPNLSWEAKGVKGYLLTKPDDWQVRVRDVIRHGPAGVDKVRRILKELGISGHVIREKYRRPDGRFAWRTVVFEVPRKAPGTPPASQAPVQPD